MAYTQTAAVAIPPITITSSLLTATNVIEPDAPNGDPAEWSNATAYVVGDYVVVTVTPNVHTVYRCIQAHTNQDPVADAGTFRVPVSGGGTYWIVIRADNRYAMFDTVNGTQSIRSDVIDVTVTPGEVVNGLAALNISAATMQVIVDDPVEGVVYDKTINLIDDSGISDWYAYFFTPIQRKTDVVLTDLPAYSAADIQAIFTETGTTVKVGVLAMGFQFQLGTALHGTNASIIDYSRKSTDEFGNFTIVQRGFSKRRDYDVIIEAGRSSAVENFLVENRTNPMVWVGHPNVPMSVAYGYFRDYTIVLSDAVTSQASIQIEGLT